MATSGEKRWPRMGRSQWPLTTVAGPNCAWDSPNWFVPSLDSQRSPVKEGGRPKIGSPSRRRRLNRYDGSTDQTLMTRSSPSQVGGG
jgi:hypothetical protein